MTFFCLAKGECIRAPFANPPKGGKKAKSRSAKRCW